MITTNRTKKAVTTMITLTMFLTIGYGQGMLIEGASKLFQSLAQKEKHAEFVAITADFSSIEEKKNDSFNITAVMNIFDRKQVNADDSNVIASFTIENIDVAYESEVNTENWMETSLSNEIETLPEIESWMTESFAYELEAAPEVESWMTESFAYELEATPQVENWMTESLAYELEATPQVENWMTTPLAENAEAVIETEDWMTTPMIANAESAITLENWMTQPLR